MFFRRRIEGEITERACTEDFLGRPITLYTLLNGKLFNIAQKDYPESPSVGDKVRVKLTGKYLASRYDESKGDILWREIKSCKVL